MAKVPGKISLWHWHPAGAMHFHHPAPWIHGKRAGEAKNLGKIGSIALKEHLYSYLASKDSIIEIYH
jgi:hypothetical protein